MHHRKGPVLEVELTREQLLKIARLAGPAGPFRTSENRELYDYIEQLIREKLGDADDVV